MKKYKILIVDDELSVRISLEDWFLEDGFNVETASSGEEALNKMTKGPYDIILLDIKMPGMDGITLQRKIREIDKQAVIIIMTAYAAVDTAVEALKLGAFDYVSKPFDPDDLTHLIRNALKQKELTDENIKLKEKITELTGFEEIIGESEAAKKIIEHIKKAAKIDTAVLIEGERGTGKEYIARAIHGSSQRRFSPFVPFNNSGAIPDSLIESELFGHEKGAIKHAQYRRKGKIELANGGTLFIADIDALSAKTQTDLLKVLETNGFTRLGGREEISVDFRLMSSSKMNMQEIVKEQKFREDLFYKINVFTIRVPPLRERKEDILPMAHHFIEQFSLSMGIERKTMSSEVKQLILDYSWPGNIRELKNAIERALVIGRGSEICVEDLPFQHKVEENKS